MTEIEQVLKATGAAIIDFREGADRRMRRRINLHAAGCHISNKRIVPPVMFLPASLAAQDVRRADLEPRFTGDVGVGNTFVSNQSPAPGGCVPAGSIVNLQLRAGRFLDPPAELTS